MYWKIDSKLPRRGFAINVAMISDTTTVILPTFIRLNWDTSLPLKYLYMSIVNIVLMLLLIDANDETIAAINAAKVKPRSPLGNKDIIVG